MPLMLFRVAFAMVLEPRIAHHHHQGTLTDRRGDVLRASRWFARAIAAFVGVAIACREVVPWVFGAVYAGSIPSLVWLAVGYGLAAWLGIGATILNMTGAPRIELFNGAITLVLNIVLCLVLIPEHGVNFVFCFVFFPSLGASAPAAATTISLAVMGALRIVQVRRHVGWSPVGARDTVPFVAVAAALALTQAADLTGVADAGLGAGLVAVSLGVEILVNRTVS
jgi:O-antigen/teichoic acid export membrane protein